MSAESTLYSALSGASGVTAIVADRIYPDQIPEDKALPAIVYGREKTEPVNTLSALHVAEFVSFRIGCWAATREGAEAIADAVVAAMAAEGEVAEDRASATDPEVGVFAVILQYRIFSIS